MLYGTKKFLRLKRNFFKYSTFSSEIQTDIPSNERKYEELLQKYRDKVLFHSILDRNKLVESYSKQQIKRSIEEKNEWKQNLKIRNSSPIPVALRFFINESDNQEPKKLVKNDMIEEQEVQLPFQNIAKIQTNAECELKTTNKNEFDCSDIEHWMKNYEYFDDTRLIEDESDDDVDVGWTANYGTPDPSCRISNVPCGGCGALLHCTDVAIPGYIPSEIFKGRSNSELKTIECQRCHFLKEYNVALNINVDPAEYLRLLEMIKNKRALVIIMVDMLDFPCSIYPNLIDIIGTKRPVIIVGNKVDLIPGDEKGYLMRMQESLMQEIHKTTLKNANIKAVSLISAKTGYGVEELISNLFKIWFCKGDVYLIGCTNVGKSSLFNALLQSDYCKVQAHDLIKRATVSRWPGTTLNLLKFPINRPSGWKIYQRNQRLKADEKLIKAEVKLQEQRNTGSSRTPVLIGRIGRSFVDPKKLDEQESDLYAYEKAGNIGTLGFDDKDEIFSQSKWFYDTPGVVHPDQILSLLTAEELLSVIPKSVLEPHSYFLTPKKTILIAGLGRLDFIDCSYPCRFTVFCSQNLPITICDTENADEIYEKFVGTDLLAVPKGNSKRMKQWVGLKPSEIIEVKGEGSKQSCSDIVLSTAGWISIAAPHNLACKIKAWTPEARGIHIRTPPLLQYGIMMKGKRVRDTPAYKPSLSKKKKLVK